MGNNQSSPLETQDEYYPGGSEQYAIDQQKKIDDERERQRAEEERQRAEQDRLRQEEEARRKREAEEEERKRAAAAAEEAERIKANTPFQKPTPPTLALTNKRSNQCQRCDIVIPPGLSSSTVILSRHIISGRPKGYPNIKKPPSAGKYSGSNWAKAYMDNFLVPEFLEADIHDYLSSVSKGTVKSIFGIYVPIYVDNNIRVDFGAKDLPIGLDLLLINLNEPDKNKWKGIPKWKCAFPDKKFPEVLVDGRPETDEIKTFGDGIKLYEEQMAEYTINVSKRNNPEMETVLWNPSETKGENGAVAINYKTHGALTKVFLKPTIPFSITYGTAIDADKAARKAEEAEKKQREEAKKKKEEDKKKDKK